MEKVETISNHRDLKTTDDSKLYMMENTLAFSVWQSVTNAEIKSCSKRWILNKLPVYVMRKTWKTVNLLNHKLGNSTAVTRCTLIGGICYSILQNSLHLQGTKACNITICHYYVNALTRMRTHIMEAMIHSSLGSKSDGTRFPSPVSPFPFSYLQWGNSLHQLGRLVGCYGLTVEYIITCLENDGRQYIHSVYVLQ